MFVIREAGPADFHGVFALARLLDSYNLPADRRYVRRLLQISRASFRGRIRKGQAKYLFVLESVPGARRGPGAGRIVGCSLIMAKHGTRGRPHLWLAQERVRKASRTLPIRRSHEVLRMKWTEDGPTEIGGLVLLPGFRRHPERCGLQIAMARFLYMAIHPERFERKVLIEYRGAMGAGGQSPFWEAVGRVFTGLPYHRADRLSVENKEFIRSLLPREPIYCALLPRHVRRAIGAVHPAAKHAVRMAERQGFRRLRQIEPFDGGPYYSAPLRAIAMVRRARRGRLAEAPLRGTPPDESFKEAPPRAAAQRLALVGTEAGGTFRAVLAGGRWAGARWRMNRAASGLLRASEGDSVHVSPL